jgi:hypothetical protein
MSFGQLSESFIDEVFKYFRLWNACQNLILESNFYNFRLLATFKSLCIKDYMVEITFL